MPAALLNCDTLENLLDTLKLSDTDLRERITQLARPIGVEFHRDLTLLLRQFSTADLERFVGLWSKVDASMRSAFIAFVVTGDDPEGRFLAYLDENKECQEAVDLAFAAHIDGLHDLGKSLSEAGQGASENKTREIVSLISEAEQAEDALENAEEALESREHESSLQPVLQDIQAALSAVGETKKGLKVLAGIVE